MKIKALTLALAAMITFGGASSALAAYNGVCTPDMTSFDSTSAFAVHCSNNNTWYFAYTFTTGSGCSPVSMDTLKVWESMSSTALLAGKNLNINVTNQGASCQGIIWMQLNK